MKLADEGGRLPADLPHHPLLVRVGEGIALGVTLRQSDGAELEAAAELHPAALPSVISVLPPPMSMTTAARGPPPVAYNAA